MFLRGESSKSVFQIEYRKQLLAALTVTLMTFCHGIGLGWFAPMVTKFQSATDTPLDFTASVNEISWIGAWISIGAGFGNILFGQMMDRLGRKISIYCLAVPHMCFWILLFFAQSSIYLHVARFCAGVSGGGVYVVIPIFIGEIADPSIRGRLTSLFQLTYNCGMLIGFILSSHVPYHIIPCSVIGFPLLYLLLEMFFPETPLYLLRRGEDELARKSLRFYLNAKLDQKQGMEEFNAMFTELRTAVLEHKSQTDNVVLRDFLTPDALYALGVSLVVLIINVFTGSFALVNYMSSIFAAVRTELHPDINTVIIGVVQIIGTIIAIFVVDHYGRKILLIVSTAFMGLGLAAFGVYAYFAEQMSMDLRQFSSWLPLLLMAFIILMANIGIIPVPYVLLVELLPPKIRSIAASCCLALLSIFGFILLKTFPPLMISYGVAASMWLCATVAVFGLLFIVIIVKETKGTSVNTVARSK